MEKDENKKDNKNESSGYLFSGPLVTLKVLFFDILACVLRLSSEGLQAYSLFSNSDKSQYGFVTLFILFLPGIAAAIHLISVYRFEWIWYYTILYALCAIVFYPFLPIVAFLHLLWMTPADGKITDEYKRAQHAATVTQSIHGCIASPIQLSYQLYLAFNGVQLFHDTTRNTHITVKDWSDNTYNVDFAAPVCIFMQIIT